MKTKKPQHSQNKRAFDETMKAFRSGKDLGLGAVNIYLQHPEGCRCNLGLDCSCGIGRRKGAMPSKASANPARPTTIDFQCDVMTAIKAKLKEGLLAKFLQAYVLFDSEDTIDIEQHAQKVLGDRRHSVEQRLGAEFRRRQIFPVTGEHGYFHSLRRAHGKV